MMLAERKRRSLTKAISWRIMATFATMGIVFVITGKTALTLAAGVIDVLLKMLLYYFHERAWNKVYWGKARWNPHVLWFTGLPASGKSTLSKSVAQELKKMDVSFEQLDGDVLRDIFPKTGFSKEQRNMHIRRVGFLAGLLEKNGVCAICSFISPYRESRRFVQQNTQRFVEIYLSTPLEVCEKRDTKGLYRKARRGEIKQFTGIDDPYEAPENPSLIIDTSHQSVDVSTKMVICYLKRNGIAF